MYKLVVVEDERDVRQRLLSLIAKAGSDFALVAEYENGVDAYDGILTDKPDLIITDIRIPYISGIELAKKVRDVLPLCKIIIVTGYSEFDYAKEAANLGVVGFVSKPITLELVASLLQKTKELLDLEYVTAANLSQLEAFYQSSLPIIRENDLSRLAGMRSVSPDFEKKLNYNHISLDYACFVLCLFDLDRAVEGWAEGDDLAFASTRRFVEESLGPLWDLELFGRQDKLCLLLKCREEPEIPQLERLLERIILRYADLPMSVGISAAHRDKNFAAMWEEAAQALEYRSVMGGRKAFYYGNAALPPGAGLADDDGVRELGYLLRFRPEEECLAALEGIRQTLEEEGGRSYYYLITGILNALLKACDDLEGLYRAAGGQDTLYRRLLEAKTAGEAFGFLAELIRTIRRLNDGVLVDNVERNLQKVLTYMESHYCDPDLSFESLAGAVNFSVSYISALLKKKLGTSFVKHLTALRMERAKELLNNPALKIIDVAEQLGYTDPYYFSHCFKKYTGASPKEFRSNG